jgi:hypothetical protein
VNDFDVLCAIVFFLFSSSVEAPVVSARSMHSHATSHDFFIFYLYLLSFIRWRLHCAGLDEDRSGTLDADEAIEGLAAAAADVAAVTARSAAGATVSVFDVNVEKAVGNVEL